MFLSLSTGCLYLLPLRSTFRLAAEAGLGAVELVMAPEVWLRGAAHVQRLAKAYGLTIPTVHQALLPHSPAGGGPRRALDAVRTALALGARHVVFHGTWAQDWTEPKAQEWLRALEDCHRELAGSGTQLALENQGLRVPSDGLSVLGPLPHVRSFAEQHDLDITLDTCHAGSFGLDLVAAYQQVRRRLANVHLCDTQPCRKSRSANVRYMSSQHHLVGRGELAFGPLLRQLQQDGYSGPLTLEISPFALQVWSPAKRAQHLAAMIGYVYQQLEPDYEPVKEYGDHALQIAHL